LRIWAVGGFFANAYVEGIVSLMISPRGVKNGAAPYFGGGGALVAAAGQATSGPRSSWPA